jgi:hypothetical protein
VLSVETVHPALPGAAAGDRLEHMYYDHLTLEPGPAASVLAVNEDGDPVVVVGEAGHGKVMFDGNINFTADGQDEPLTGANALLARGAVEWFTGVKLQPE